MLNLRDIHNVQEWPKSTLQGPLILSNSAYHKTALKFKNIYAYITALILF